MAKKIEPTVIDVEAATEDHPMIEVDGKQFECKRRPTVIHALRLGSGDPVQLLRLLTHVLGEDGVDALTDHLAETSSTLDGDGEALAKIAEGIVAHYFSAESPKA